MKLDYIKWEDPNEITEIDLKDGYLGWGYQLNLGQINIGWLPAYKNDKFKLAIQHLNWMNEPGINDEYSLEGAKEMVMKWATEIK